MRYICWLVLICCSLFSPAYAIDNAELKAQLRQIIKENEKQIKEDAAVEFDKLDANHDRVITEDEFLNQQFAPNADKDGVRQTFNQIDRNHNGQLTKSEMFAFMKRQMENYLNSL